MIDLVALTLKAGNGGMGRVSFWREKYVPKGGPDGGNGGLGGNIIVRGSTALTTLKHLAGVKEIIAPSGEAGGKRRRFGAKGEDVVIEVPVGTVLWLLAETQTSARRQRQMGLERLMGKGDVEMERYELVKEGWPIPPRDEEELVPVDSSLSLEGLNKKNLAIKELPKRQLLEITEDGQEVVLCQGGFGGRGNEAFKGPERTTPLVAEYGTWGEQKTVIFELKLLAEVGLVGFPNAGKSTLLSRLTKATPKIADYPFTTLEPHLGVLKKTTDNTLPRDIVVADIPGLIEGAQAGKGLGYEFLRHVENCKALFFLLSLDENLIFADHLSWEDKADVMWEQLQVLRGELKGYAETLLEKAYVIGLSKSDLYPDELIGAVVAKFKKEGEVITPFSAATGVGLNQVFKALGRILD